MHDTIGDHLLTDAQPTSKQWLLPAHSQFPPVFKFFHMKSCGMEYPVGHLVSAVLMPPAPSLAGQYEKLRNWNILGSVWHCSAPTKPLVCYQHCFSLKVKTQHNTRCNEEIQLCPNWNQNNSSVWELSLGVMRKRQTFQSPLKSEKVKREHGWRSGSSPWDTKPGSPNSWANAVT